MGNVDKFWQIDQNLDDFQNLKSGWDGYSAEKANKLSIGDARIFMAKLPACTHPMKVMLASDGEVSFYWDHGGTYLEVSFPGDGTYHWIYNSAQRRLGIDDVSLSAPVLDARLIEELERQEPTRWVHSA